MSRIKIDEPGWAGYTGSLGPIEFLDGVSIEPVSTRDAHRIGGSMLITYVDGPDAGKQASVTAREVALRELPAPAEAVLTAPAAQEPEVKQVAKYTREELEKLADEKGIKGLREIGDQFGVKGTSISGLIDEILLAQGVAAVEGKVD